MSASFEESPTLPKANPRPDVHEQNGRVNEEALAVWISKRREHKKINPELFDREFPLWSWVAVADLQKNSEPF